MPFVYRDVVAVSAEGVDHTKMHTAWFPETKKVGPRVFAVIVTGEHRFKQYVGGDTSMVNAMIQARNAAVRDAMIRNCSEAEDPSAEHVLPKRSRQEMIDHIPEVLTATVTKADGTAVTFRCLSHWSEGGKLSIELTEDNMRLLTEKPAAVPVENAFMPEITQPNVQWSSARRSVYCKYRSSETKKNQTKAMIVRSHEDEAVYQERVDAMAAVPIATELDELILNAGWRARALTAERWVTRWPPAALAREQNVQSWKRPPRRPLL